MTTDPPAETPGPPPYLNAAAAEARTEGGPPEYSSAAAYDTVDLPPEYAEGAELPQYDERNEKKVNLPPYTDNSCTHEGEYTAPIRDTQGMYWGRLVLPQHELGTDTIFLLSFVVCFLLNWVGYLLCICLCTSIAARSGALSGIGLSFVKWLLIMKRYSFENPNMVRFQEYMQLHEIQYLILMTLGLFVVFSGIFRYNSFKASVRRGELLLA